MGLFFFGLGVKVSYTIGRGLSFNGTTPKDSSGDSLRARNVSPTLLCNVFMFPRSLGMFTLNGELNYVS